MLIRLRFLILIVLATFSFISCNSGSSSDPFIGAAIVKITASPENIDTGDRTQISIEISEIHDNGIVLKALFSKGLTYVPGSSKLVIEDLETTINPAIDRKSADRDDRFLIYFIPSAPFQNFEENNNNPDKKDGKLIFELEAFDEIKDGVIEIDADVNDPLIDDNVEFDIQNPEFLSETEASIKVEG